VGHSTHGLAARSHWTCPKPACGKANLSAVWPTVISVSKRHFNSVHKWEGGWGKGQESDILGRSFIPSLNQPPLSTQRTTPWCSGPQLAVPFGFNTDKGEYRCSTLEELQPLWREGSRVETANVWHVSSLSLDIQLPHPLCDKTRQRNLRFALGIRYKRDVSNSLSRGQMNHQTKAHWLVQYVTSGTPPCSARSHKPGKRIKSSRSTSLRSHSLETQPRSSSWIRPALNYPSGKKKEVQLFVEQIFGTKA